MIQDALEYNSVSALYGRGANYRETDIIPGLDVTFPTEFFRVDIQMPSFGMWGRSKSSRRVLWVEILRSYGPSLRRFWGRGCGARTARDENIALYRGGQDAKEGVIDVFTYVLR